MESDTLAATLERSWQRAPERPALIHGERRMSFGGLGAAVVALAETYRRAGIGRGDRIVCCVSNRQELIVALGAAWYCGAVHVGVDHQSTAPELTALIELTGAAAVVYEPAAGAPDSGCGIVLHELRQRHPGLRIVDVGDLGLRLGDVTISTANGGGDATDFAAAARPAVALPDDPAMLFVSSGTTGTPKVALGYHGNLSQRWLRLAGWLDFGPDDVHLAHLPLSHGFGLMMAVAGLLSGGRLVLLDQFSAEPALRAVATERVTVLNGAPAHFRLILNRLERGRHDVASLRLGVGSAAPFPPSLLHEIWDGLGLTFMVMYGSSEGVGVATTDRDDMLRGAVGRPAPGAVTIVGPDRQPLPVGTLGEIAFSRRAYPVRYWGESERPAPGTEDSADERWYYSGDIGRLDDLRRLYVYGRLKHQIDRGGLKIDPVEVEAALLRCPGVADAATIGLPNPILGETLCACVVPAPGSALALPALRAVLGTTLAPFKLPEELCLLERIPRTSIGKVDLNRLRAVAATATRQQLVPR